ncbi:MAG: mRNA surveillance protein pelota, partial [Thermoplasmata archaeon]|nr:mRNA surveillance protein pelota [Thermoplasmata archaeon]
MKILNRDKKTGEIKLLMQTPDDLWHVYNLVEPGDLVIAISFRREEKIHGKLRPERMGKKKMKIGLRAEKAEFHEFTDRLRIQGVIEHAPQDLGEHHTFNFKVRDTLSIVKEWKDHHMTRLNDAVEATHEPLITFLSIDDESALLAQLHQYGIEELVEIRSSGTGKMYPTKGGREEYLGEIISKLQSMDIGEALIVLGPGFEKEALTDRIRDKLPDITPKLNLFPTSHCGMLGIQEALKGGMASEVLEKSRVGMETKLVEQLLSEIATEGKYAYGLEEVQRATEQGAVETLLVTNMMIRKAEIEALLKGVETARGKIVIVSSEHEA